MPTYKDINILTQKSAVAGTEKLPVSDMEYITPSQITESLDNQINGGTGEITKSYSWSYGYVSTPRISTSSASLFCQPVKFHAGDRLTYKAGSTYGYAVVQVPDDSALTAGGPITIVQTLIEAGVANREYQYTFASDMWVVISVYEASYELHVYSNAPGLSDRVSTLESQVGDIATILASI